MSVTTADQDSCQQEGLVTCVLVYGSGCQGYRYSGILRLANTASLKPGSWCMTLNINIFHVFIVYVR